MLASGFWVVDFLLTSSASGLGLRLRSGCVVGSGAFVRLRVASCSNARRLVEVSVVVVVILRTCDACDPALLSLAVLRSRSVAALAGRDCCWRRAAEARRSATEAPREGWLEAIVCLVHSRSDLLFEQYRKYPKPLLAYQTWYIACELQLVQHQHQFTHHSSNCGDRVRQTESASCAKP
jgi:hypothetical protein